VATSAYQIEGAWNEDGKGPSILDTYAHTPGNIKNDENGDVANDHYHRYQEDVALMQDIGATASGSRSPGRGSSREAPASPTPRGWTSTAGWWTSCWPPASNRSPPSTTETCPQTLQDRSGGWQSKDTAKAFADYAGYVAEQLGDRMRHYFTINEFRSFVEGGYQLVDVKVGGKTLHLDGAPGLRLSDVELKQVRHHAVLSHGLAVQAIRARGPAGTKVGFAENIRVAVPIIDTLEYVQAAQAATRERNAGFMTVMLEGRYTDERLRSLRPGGRGRQGLRHRPGHVPARLPGTAPAGHLGGRAGERLLPLERPGQLRMGRRLRQPLRTDLRRLRGEAASWFSCSRSRRPGRFPA
jgi:beta-glucosidase